MADETDFGDLIAELPAWNDGEGIPPETWIECVGSYELAIGYSVVFWPRFVVIDGYVLRAGTTVENLREWEQATGRNRQAIEAVINHIHIADLHTNATEPNDAQVSYLVRVRQEMHAAQLK